MTALLSCDGCGTIVSDRAEDDDPTASWWCLSFAPVIGAGGLLPIISMDVDEAIFGGEPEDLEVVPIEPDRHFCSVPCLGAWVTRREAP